MKFFLSLAALTLASQPAQADETTLLKCDTKSALVSIEVQTNDQGEGSLTSTIVPRLGHGELRETHAVRLQHYHIGDLYTGPTARLLVVRKTEGTVFAKYSHPGLSGEQQELLLECAIF